MAFHLLLLLLVVVLMGSVVNEVGGVEFKTGAYEDLVVEIQDEVPSGNCKEILENLELVLSTSSHRLHAALHGRAFFKSSTIIIPSSWPDSCALNKIAAAEGESPDITVINSEFPTEKIWTQQSEGCGKQGDQIYFNYEALKSTENNQENVGTLGRLLVKSFASYRYGVFEEKGYESNPVNPVCYYNETNALKATGCSDFEIGIKDCEKGKFEMDSKARTSIMFEAETPTVTMFCDHGNHDRNAPTRHNTLCDAKSTFEVIRGHDDFRTEADRKNFTNVQIAYKKRIKTNYVFVIENTKNMAVRESWSFLRSAIRKWVQIDLPENSEVGLILINNTDASVGFDISNFPKTKEEKSAISSSLPYYPSETMETPRFSRALAKATQMLEGIETGSKVVVLVCAGIGANEEEEMEEALGKMRRKRIRMATVTYPSRVRGGNLDSIAKKTGGVSYDVEEQKQNVQHSMISTYFELCNVLYNVLERFHEGNGNELAVEIHRREMRADRPVAGSFYVDEDLSAGPLGFRLFTHNPEPLIRTIELTGPNQKRFLQRIDSLDIKIVSVRVPAERPLEAGTWTYRVEPVPGNPQPHFLQVTAFPGPGVVRAEFRIAGRNPPVLLVEVKKRNRPVIGAKVEVKVEKIGDSQADENVFKKQEIVQLFDTGSGDPDISKNDGIYSRYYNFGTLGAGKYRFEVKIDDNGNTAYLIEDKKASMVPPFERHLNPITIEVPPEDVFPKANQIVGRILDLQAKIDANQSKAVLRWTSPDMGGANVGGYEIKYAEKIEDLRDFFGVGAKIWAPGVPHALSLGSETNFVLDFSKTPDLYDRNLYFAVKAIKGGYSTVSNVIRIFMKSPVKTMKNPIVFKNKIKKNENKSIPNKEIDSDLNQKPEETFIDETNEKLLFLIVIVLIFLLIVTLIIYYCLCVRRESNTKPKFSKSETENPEIGMNFEESETEQKKIGNFDIKQHQEQLLIEEKLKSTSNYATTPLQIQRNLSPFNSWTASQLLYEHEKTRQTQEIVEAPSRVNLNVSNFAPQLSANREAATEAPPVPPPPVYAHEFELNYPPTVVANGDPYGGYAYSVAYHPDADAADNQFYQPVSGRGSVNSISSTVLNPLVNGCQGKPGERRVRNVTMV